jgi:hypothetical protein
MILLKYSIGRPPSFGATIYNKCVFSGKDCFFLDPLIAGLSNNYAVMCTELLNTGQTWRALPPTPVWPATSSTGQLAENSAFLDNLSHPCRWHSRCSVSGDQYFIKENNDETTACNHVQKTSGQNNSTASDNLQALRRADLFVELLEGSSRRSPQKNTLTANGRRGTMEISIIPWEIFRATLKKQQPRTLDAWLRHWLFTNEGVIWAGQQATVIR